mmetsp:Transcript_4701/g.8996  ORF Transcript_4701/g.8996 Transcript_4701/m.8996 type:complete len:381 (-) Transcript_4701:132-1274(-)
MANSAFDPLRDDPFAGAPQPLAITPFSAAGGRGQQLASSSASSPWALQQQQPQEQPDDVLLMFNNTNNSHQKERPRSNSIASSRAGGGSTYSVTGSRAASQASGGSKFVKLLDDATFAPPPEKPVTKNYIQSLFHAEADAAPSSLPDWNLIKHSGTCLARISLRTLIMKKWKQIFWISYGDHTMLFFKSRFHFEDWAMDPNLSMEQREKKVKLRVDFLHLDASTRKDTEHIRGFQTSMIKGKQYKSKGMVYQFKLDKWTDQGPSINAAFGSETEDDVRELHIIMNAMLRTSPTTSLAMAQYAASRDTTGDDSSGYFGTTDYDSVRNEPNQMQAYSSGSVDGRSHYSGRSNYSGRSYNSANSNGSKSKYFVNGLKARVSRS